MLNNPQVDIKEQELPLQPKDKFEKKGVDYFLNDVQIPSVSTILGSSGGGKSSAKGNAFHEAMASFMLGHHLEQGISVQELFKDCNPEDFKIAITLSDFLKDNNLKPKYVEHKFYHEIEGCIYAGTIDLVCEDEEGHLHVFDYKTGTTISNKHGVQISAYAEGIGAKKGYLVYRGKIFLKYVQYTEPFTDLTGDFLEFKDLLLAYYGKLEGQVWHNGNIYFTDENKIDASKTLYDLIMKKKEIEEEIEDIKSFISNNLDEKGLKNEYLLVSYVKSRVNKTLKAEIKKELMSSNPEYFIETEVTSHFNFKTQGEA